MMPTPTIGHNSPPPIEAHSLHIEDLFSTVSGSLACPITTDEQEAGLASLLDEVRRARKAADDQRAIEKRPHDEAAAAVQAAYKPLLARCDTALAALKAALTPYREARQQAKDEAARKAREEAEELQRRAQESFRTPVDLEERFEAEQNLHLADKMRAIANKIDRTATGLRTYWEAEIADRRAALNHYIRRSPERFEALVQQLADEDARGVRAPVPGINFIERKRAA